MVMVKRYGLFYPAQLWIWWQLCVFSYLYKLLHQGVSTSKGELDDYLLEAPSSPESSPDEEAYSARPQECSAPVRLEDEARRRSGDADTQSTSIQIRANAPFESSESGLWSHGLGGGPHRAAAWAVAALALVLLPPLAISYYYNWFRPNAPYAPHAFVPSVRLD